MILNLFEGVTSSPLFGLGITFGFIQLGLHLQKMTKSTICNPLVVAVICVIFTLLTFDIPYEQYEEQTQILPILLTPVTAVLGLNIYRQRSILKEYFVPVVVGCLVGTATSLGLVYGLCHLLGVSAEMESSLLPKSATTAIALAVGESRGGVSSLIVTAVLVAGSAGAMFAPQFAKLFGIENPVAEGIAIGTCSHALGTTRAMSIGEVQGAMSSVAICICGIFTSVLVLFLP